MLKLKVTQRDIKLSIILLSLVILGLTYQFVYLKNIAETDLINADIKQLNIKLTEKRNMLAKKEDMESDTKTIRNEINDIVNSYGDGASEEKSLMFVKNLENEADMTISSVSIAEPQYFLSATAPIAEENKTTDQGDAEELNIKTLQGYQSTMSVSFKTNYQGLKKCLDFINNYPCKSTISELTTSYDPSSGNLAGTMSIQQYHLQGQGREYTDPDIPYVDIGTDNIFGTIELPVE